MDDFLQEIEQDIRQEKVWQFWQKYRTQITWGAGVALVLAAVWNMWTWHTNRQQAQWGESFVKAQMLLDQGKIDEAMRYLGTLEHTGSSYAVLSSFVKAHFYAQDGDHRNADNAIASFEKISQYKHVSPELREFAVLCSIMTRMDGDKPDLDSLLQKVEPLCANTSFWPLLAQEIKAGLLLMMGKKAEAHDVLVSIAQNSDAPAAMRSRAQILSRSTGSLPSDTTSSQN